ncbi:hypothetical protein [Desertimonas flava]|uniref:hypothetical protein n=1 Tax=Desertimonas flava TaxID=2064846 RepID=UPI000E356B66|nr:hypothetical protein [Desertimonas flava]
MTLAVWLRQCTGDPEPSTIPIESLKPGTELVVHGLFDRLTTIRYRRHGRCADGGRWVAGTNRWGLVTVVRANAVVSVRR